MLRIPRILPLLALTAQVAAGPPVGDFSHGNLDGWQTKAFEGRTRYRLTETDRGLALCAHSQGSASGLYRQVSVDLRRQPYLHWSWRVEGVLPGIDETTRAGDDFPARIYAIRWGGLLFWRTRVLVYVWSSSRPPGSFWPSAYSTRVANLALRSGAGESGRWQQERRDVAADFRAAFGETVDHVDAVALMTDTDDSGGRASACYGDIAFEAASSDGGQAPAPASAR